jgi:pimeloyl-ACP methyl ester carboxylesterase
MREFYKASKLLVAWSTGKKSRVDQWRGELSLEQGEDLSFQCFQPTRGKKIEGTILFVHGMSFLGNEDPRQVEVCEALASIGYQVVSPHFPEIADLRIELETVDRIAAVVRAIVDHSQLDVQGKIGILSASFSAGMCLVASMRDGVGEHLACICSIGGFSSVKDCLRSVIQGEEVDEYARLIMLRNFAPPLYDCQPLFEQCVEELLRDNGLKRSPPQAPEIMGQLSTEARYLLDALRFDPAARSGFSDLLFAQFANLLSELDILSHIDKISCPVVLIHGAQDDVIPPGESLRLAKALKANGLRHHFVLSKLISHGDRQPVFGKAREFVLLARGFSSFLSALRTPVTQM